MKLYTEEQVIEMTKAAFAAGQNHNSFIFWEEIKNITPIELPSDEEIDIIALYFAKKYKLTTSEISALIIGAKWMRDITQGGNK